MTEGVVMPAMVAPAPEAAPVIDTSGSITPATLTDFLAEVTTIITRASVPGQAATCG
jgi:predicted metal-dependent peptidase